MISTHPDEDHVEYLDTQMPVANSIVLPLRNGSKAFYNSQGKLAVTDEPGERRTRLLTASGNRAMIPDARRDSDMRNPWLKKNPAMSIFLSAANAWAGAFRGHATAAVKRNMAAAMKSPKKKPLKRRSF